VIDESVMVKPIRGSGCANKKAQSKPRLSGPFTLSQFPFTGSFRLAHQVIDRRLYVGVRDSGHAALGRHGVLAV